MAERVELIALDTGELLRADNQTPVANVDLDEVPLDQWEEVVKFSNAAPVILKALREARLSLSAHPNTSLVLRYVDAALDAVGA